MDAPLKKILRALSLELRHTLEGSYEEDGTWNAGDIERRLNQIGIWRDKDRKPKPTSEMPNLSPMDRKAREMIDAYLALRSDAGVSQTDAVAEFIRESAYSWANRLFALRCMEARGINDPVILQEETYHGRSMVHDRYAQMNPSQCTDEDDGLFAMLLEEFREHSQELPDLFAPDSPAVALRPSVVALKHCIALLSGSIPANGGKATDAVFTAPDAFGWAYQYWNAEEKDRVFEMVRTKKGAKIEGSDIIPATQLYTEPYMVKFLVQNSLGATWMMMHPESKLSAAWVYYVKDADRTPNDKKPVSEITFLDPACGSGHFLIEAFDLLYTMYEDEGDIKEPAAICRSILNNNLFGIDIDERAIQITKAVLWMKAAETVFAKAKKPLSGQGLSEFHDHIIATNIRLPKGKDHLDTFLKKHPDDAPLRPALLTVFEGLQNAHELGSLVQIEEPVEKELKALKEQARQQKFDPESGEVVEKVNFPRWKQQVMKRLKAHFQDEAEKALPTEAFFSQSAVKGLALFDLLARRYDVVAANPPFMGSSNFGQKIKSYLNSIYPLGKSDLYAAFILRNISLLKNNAKIAMITPQSWLFFKSYSELRLNIEHEKSRKNDERFNGILKDFKIEIISHLGAKAFHEGPKGFDYGIVLFVISKTPIEEEHQIVSYRLIGLRTPEEKETALKENIAQSNPNITYKINQKIFLTIPKSPICYWLSSNFLRILSNQPPIGRNVDGLFEVRDGMNTGDNNRFVRYHWECSIQKKNEWCAFSKGGGYKKWYGNNFYSLRWGVSGEFIRNANLSGTALRNTDYYFKDLLCYSLVAGGSLGIRDLVNSAFDGAGLAIIPYNKKEKYAIAALLNTRVSSFFCRLLSQDIKFRGGYVERIPKPYESINNLNTLGRSSLICKKEIVNQNIIERYFIGRQFLNNRINFFDLFQKWNIIVYLHVLEGQIEVFVNSFYKLTKEDQKTILAETGTPAGFYPLVAGYKALPPLPSEISEIPVEIITNLDKHNEVTFTPGDLTSVKKRLRTIYENGFNIKDEIEESESAISEEKNDTLTIGAHIPIPAETFLEELSQRMEIHPISIYWLLKEGIEKEGWRCIPEEKRYTEDLFTVIVLRLLGHRWPKQIDAGEPVPEWADADGIIPITSGLMYPTLLQQVRDHIASEFPSGKVHEIEKEFEEVVGMPLERWLTGEFFKHHISQFKKRPIAWQLSSSPAGNIIGKGKGRGSRREPAFSCLVYYHKIDADFLHKIRTQYVGDLINRYGTELRALDGRSELTVDQATRKVQLDNWITELTDFSKALQDVADTGFESLILNEIVLREPLDKWTSVDGQIQHPKSVEEFHAQEKRYNPDINDGVRVNIAPLQKVGLLSAEVIAKKDVEEAISDRAEWRADERRWCRGGFYTKLDWWG